MAHFANVDSANKVVAVIVIPDEHESDGHGFITNVLGLEGNWIQTSYTSRGGKRVNPDTNEVVNESDHFRYNYAGIGYSWDENFGDDGAFIEPKPEDNPSFVLDLLSATWVPPIPMPDESPDGIWVWDEESISWTLIPNPVEE